MKRTFVFRGQDILEGTITTEDLFTIYPPLKNHKYVADNGYAYIGLTIMFQSYVAV